MNETRKAIIELIEPYMDKTISFGCMFWYHTPMRGGDKRPFFTYKWEGEWDNEDYLSPDKMGPNNKAFKIIGHYDITAVLKYIKGKKYKREDDYIIDDIEDVYYNEGKIYYGINDGGEFSLCLIGEIPNKPLHLYTEQEELQLLEILNKLK